MSGTCSDLYFETIVARYVRDVQAGGPAAIEAAIAATANNPTTVIEGLLAAAWDLGYRDGTESEKMQDAWWDSMEAAIPVVAEALRAVRLPEYRHDFWEMW